MDDIGDFDLNVLGVAASEIGEGGHAEDEVSYLESGGLRASCNDFTGEIPAEDGRFVE